MEINKITFTNIMLDNLNKSISDNGKVDLEHFINLTNKTYEDINYSHCCDTLNINDLMTFEDYKTKLFTKADGVYQPKKTNIFRWYSEKQLKKMYNKKHV